MFSFGYNLNTSLLRTVHWIINAILLIIIFIKIIDERSRINAICSNYSRTIILSHTNLNLCARNLYSFCTFLRSSVPTNSFFFFNKRGMHVRKERKKKEKEKEMDVRGKIKSYILINLKVKYD